MTFISDFLRRLRRPPTRPTSKQATEPGKVAFIFLGGGAHGAAQAGALSVVAAEGIVPDIVLGISVGALNAAYWAIDPTPGRAHALEAVWRATTTHDVLGTMRWRAAVSAVTNRGTLYDAAGISRIATRHLGALTFKDLTLPLGILSMNVTKGEPIIFESGPLTTAVLASSAIPGIFPPVRIGSEYYVDGGLAEWAAYEAALAAGARTMYVLGCGVVTPRDLRLETLTGLLERSWDVASQYSMRYYIQSSQAVGAEVIAIQPEITATSMLDFNKSDVLVQAGRATAKQVLAAHRAHQRDALPAS